METYKAMAKSKTGAPCMAWPLPAIRFRTMGFWKSYVLIYLPSTLPGKVLPDGFCQFGFGYGNAHDFVVPLCIH
jgi:hypothetical protein